MSNPLAAVARLTDALSRAASMDEVYGATLDALQQSLGVDRASILLFDAQDVMRFVAWRGISDAYRRAVDGHTPWRPDTASPEPICVVDVRESADLARFHDVFEAEGIRAATFFPLCHRDRVIGKFMVYYSEPHACDGDELALAKTIAGQIAFAIVRLRIENELDRERTRLADIVAHVPGVVWESSGPPGVIPRRTTFINDQIVTLLGYPRSFWFDDPDGANVVFEEDVPIVRAFSAEAAAGRAAAAQFRLRRADGSVIWVDSRCSSRREGDEIVARGFTIDITARKKAEAERDALLAEAQAAEKRAELLSRVSSVLGSSLDYETTLEHLGQLIVADLADWCAIDMRDEDDTLRRLAVRHRDGERVAESLRWLRDYGPEKHRTGNTLRVLETGEPMFVRDANAGFWQQMEGSEEITHHMRILGVESFILVPLSTGGETIGVLSIVSASAQRLYDERDLDLAMEVGRRAGYAVTHARLYKQAQEANRAKDEFLATLSHELRTPMTATLGWATMLRIPEISAENFRLAVETIERSTRAQAKLIDEILDVSRIVTGKLQLVPAPVNLAAIIEAAVEAIRPSITAKGLQLTLDLGSLDGVPSGDAARLQQVIWNLLSNSVKFTPSGGAIVVTLDQPRADQARIAVRDGGSGIPKKLLPVIFERFRQGDTSSTRAYGGLGLGLAIVKNIVELHGGSVTASSDGEGKGATFTITLPVARGVPALTAHPVAASTPLTLAGLSILLVEDEDDTRRMLAAALQNFGASVTAVATVSAALDALRASRPHVLVSDISMPGEDGYSLIMKVRSGEVTRALPAVALTAYARPEDREKILASGFDSHLAKPVDPLVMANTIRAAAAGR